jgi:NO-binding membrane sensor protein with MHYT domain
MLPLAVIGRVEWLLILGVVSLLFGAPLLIACLVLGSWLRRTGRGSAFRTYVGAAICSVVAGLAFFGALAFSIGIRNHVRVQDEYLHRHPLAVALLIGLWGVVALAGFACAFFGAWTAWRLIQAPPSVPVAQQR